MPLSETELEFTRRHTRNLEPAKSGHHHQYMDDFEPWMLKEAKLVEILYEGHPDDRLYVYWICDGNRVSPAIYKCVPFEELYEFLRDEYGQQSYYIMVRRKKKMICTAEISIGIPLNFVPKKDIRLEIQRLRDEELAKKKRTGKRSQKRKNKRT